MWKMTGLLVLLIFSVNIANGQAINTTISVGTLTGYSETVTLDGVQYTVDKYLGVPFAQPPVGDLRLKKPAALESLPSDPYNATYHRPYCIQGFSAPPTNTNVEDEDCLYLNVYVPDQPADENTGHAVMVFIYGGGFSIGAADLYDGTILAAMGNVIVVTLNYRLTFFGFFSTQDDVAPGNYGLFDQKMALQWVHDNIAEFGGDINRVTVFGQSAGGMAADFQAMYPANHGLFQRIITESGVATSPYLDSGRDRKSGVTLLAAALNCSSDSSQDIVDCLMTKPWLVIKNAVVQITSEVLNWDLLFLMPIVDGDILKVDYTRLNMMDSHSELTENLNLYRSLDVMHGFNRFDGGTFLNLMIGSLFGLNDWEPTQEDVSNIYLDRVRTITKEGPYPDFVKNAIHHEYTDWSDPELVQNIRVQLAKLLTDYVYANPAAYSANLHYSTDSNTFMFRFMPATSGRLAYQPLWLPGADHSEELMMVFGMGYNSLSAEEKTLSSRIMMYWSNFAKSGDPNSPVSVVATWPMFNPTNTSYIELDHNMGDHSGKDRIVNREINFWGKIVPGLLSVDVDDGNDVCVSAAGREVIAPVLLVSLVLSTLGRWVS